MSAQLTLLVEFKHDRFYACAPYESDQWASTDRGWSYLVSHPDDREFETDYYSRCCGNYLDYGQLDDGKRAEHIRIEHPEGTVHACAYVHRVDPVTRSQYHVGLGSKWCASMHDATEWIEAQVTAYLQRS